MHNNPEVFEFDSEEQLAETIRHFTTHPAWTGFFVPNMEQRRDHAINLLCVHPDMRGNPITDEALRQRIAVLNEILQDGVGKVLEWDTLKAQNDAPLEYKHNLEERAALGHIGPLRMG